jgi:serine/threonine protein kinase
LDGQLVPDVPYLDPLLVPWLTKALVDFQSPKVDIYSSGIVVYIIVTGYYPFHQGPASREGEKNAYAARVRQMFHRGEFSDLSGVPFGGVIAGCCCNRRFGTAKEVVEAIENEIRESRVSSTLSHPFQADLVYPSPSKQVPSH